MKKIINNKIYNTENCELIVNFSEKIVNKTILVSLYPYYKIELYKAKDGTYLKYIGDSVESGWQDKKDLLIVSEVYVKKTLIELNEIDNYIKFFGQLEEI